MSHSKGPRFTLVRRVAETAVLPLHVLKAVVMIVAQLTTFFAFAIAARVQGAWNLRKQRPVLRPSIA